MISEKICSPEIVELQFFPLGGKLVLGLSDNVPLEKWSLGWVLAPTFSMKLGNPVWGATLSQNGYDLSEERHRLESVYPVFPNKSQELAELGGNRNMEVGVCQIERRCPHT